MPWHPRRHPRTRFLPPAPAGHLATTHWRRLLQVRQDPGHPGVDLSAGSLLSLQSPAVAQDDSRLPILLHCRGETERARIGMTMRKVAE